MNFGTIKGPGSGVEVVNGGTICVTSRAEQSCAAKVNKISCGALILVIESLSDAW